MLLIEWDILSGIPSLAICRLASSDSLWSMLPSKAKWMASWSTWEVCLYCRSYKSNQWKCNIVNVHIIFVLIFILDRDHIRVLKSNNSGKILYMYMYSKRDILDLSVVKPLFYLSQTLKLYLTMFCGAWGLFAVRIRVNSSFNSYQKSIYTDEKFGSHHSTTLEFLVNKCLIMVH